MMWVSSLSLLKGEVWDTKTPENDLTLNIYTAEARCSRVPILLLDDPDIAVRQAYLATITDFESKPFEDSRETEIPQPLPIASSPAIPSNDPYLIVRQAHTLATIDTESEPKEAPSET
ncbi:hypothetical protein Tco_0556461 [Tanacetum coccineum]